MKNRHIETRTLQVWPSGQGFSYRGDIDGPASQKRLRVTSYNGDKPKRWRPGTADEWRSIRIQVRAALYGERDILGCDSSLIDDLIKAAGSGDLSGDLGEGFSYEEIHGLYADPSDWNADKCRDYASDNGIDLPDVPTIGDDDKPDPDADEDDSRYGWLTEAREACAEYARDNPAEVYEWWRVTSWLCKQLAGIGEVTIDNGYGCWWGRTCTGQQWIMDGTLQTVAAKFEEA